jgi:hypothetical protein
MNTRPIYVELSTYDRALLDKLTGDAGAAAGRPVRVKEVIEQLVRDAAAKGRPVRVRSVAPRGK